MISAEQKIVNSYKAIQDLQQNTVIPFSWIRENSLQYQRFLERIADYLLESDTWWVEKKNEGVEFFDKLKDNNTNLRLHHFRSNNLKNESQYLSSCWEKYLENKNKLIPAFKLKVNKENIYLSTLSYFHEQYITATEICESDVPSNDNIDETSNEVDIGAVGSVEIEPVLPELNISDITPISSVNESTESASISIEKSSNIELVSTKNSISEIHSSNKKFTQKPRQNLSMKNIVSSTPRKTKNELKDSIISIQPKKYTKDNGSILCKSAILLEKIFGKQPFINDFNSKRKRAKSTPCKYNIDSYKQSLATIEVKIKSKEDQVKNELTSLEVDAISSGDEALEDTVEYKQRVDKLKMIKSLIQSLKL